MKIEDMMNELEKIVGLLNSQNLSLDESLELYRRGIEMYKRLQEALSKAKIEVEDLYAQLHQSEVKTDADDRSAERRED
ncbi:MAG: Exodeoxyribonuclease 7 small subunit [Thermotoga sp. 50_1627]|uniref:exodeoxyribonuclease VII small subunit n=1 Tax=Pseudothermotoga sp. TaxID=2033661 RepID=UPI00076BE2C6|nr:MAG: Exodeoxyribonuclease 7 small subunit [Thermotoga sp. 50_64]KUK25662.1 MAG: Exodeoxyribonuclease 7 small subunit [Thermotoga sp. 50_1627]MBC7115575.1 exodeoxyribonuclease VII small subunit [Pseudothermotoga sp.]MDK2923675.1 exodeoxyribonuclease small subunit [Pseudothermotoga sp.]HBT40007.1 exodeoxyribonuclease VII small subunit [Pseudothermotoga sp.]